MVSICLEESVAEIKASHLMSHGFAKAMSMTLGQPTNSRSGNNLSYMEYYHVEDVESTRRMCRENRTRADDGGRLDRYKRR